MKLIAAVLALASATAAASPMCPRLTPSDAHVLTRKQLEGRVCLYIKLTKQMIEAEDANQSNACLTAAFVAEQLYQERFNRPSPCWQRAR